MDILKAVVLGLIQGLTEFLPVSSSGHLTLFQGLFGMQEATGTFNIILHVATLIGVIVVYWQDIWSLIKRPFQRTTYLLIAGTIPTVIIALLFADLIDKTFAGGKFLGFNFIITGIVLLYADSRRPGKKKMKNMSLADAFIIGTMQGVAICPAISRSGMTIATSLSRSLDRENAARFSFLLSIPAILGAMTLAIKDIVTGDVSIGDSIGILPMVFGFIAAAVSGYFAVRFMLSIIRKKKLRIFAVYVFALGAFLILDQYIFNIVIK